ncbi:hypothetical protein PVAP13_4KG109405 [Panicum virgatum]|uniref:Uncharacterized protein n=1 Tax=Panicum virgatum TaxID=38727 RepID=A0A8T0TNZ1_PANVG|nr:hypothetical protein PVAP13_4KG109405 [Panicum virgatum]
MKDHADELCACQQPRTAAQRAGERRPSAQANGTQLQYLCSVKARCVFRSIACVHWSSKGKADSTTKKNKRKARGRAEARATAIWARERSGGRADSRPPRRIRALRALRAGLRRAAPEDGGGLAAPRGRREVACAAPHGRKEGSAPRRARGEQQAARRRFGGTIAEGEEPLPRREGEGRCFL